MNNVVLMGRLTRDPQQSMAQRADGDVEISKFTLAVDRRFKRDGDQTADFISCVAFGKTAEVINKNCAQGKKIAVNGRIQTGSYTKQDGTTVYTTDVIVESMEFAESKAASSGGGQSGDWQNIPEDLDDEALPFK